MVFGFVAAFSALHVRTLHAFVEALDLVAALSGQLVALLDGLDQFQQELLDVVLDKRLVPLPAEGLSQARRVDVLLARQLELRKQLL